ncbi:hypothetical protein LPB79_13095 [Rhizobium sp. T136]|uniref:hypothetical protein n=1 Tax=Rhizobium sp. T136 TaxID=555319 RepID=UPI001E2D471D|nr:hypothetical protein [Rhizobium sp. T136]UFS83183.1 hypothetical protein LPB79_13095 [Rhizobium sp. T136]
MAGPNYGQNEALFPSPKLDLPDISMLRHFPVERILNECLKEFAHGIPGIESHTPILAKPS